MKAHKYTDKELSQESQCRSLRPRNRRTDIGIYLYHGGRTCFEESRFDYDTRELFFTSNKYDAISILRDEYEGELPDEDEDERNDDAANYRSRLDGMLDDIRESKTDRGMNIGDCSNCVEGKGVDVLASGTWVEIVPKVLKELIKEIKLRIKAHKAGNDSLTTRKRMRRLEQYGALLDECRHLAIVKNIDTNRFEADFCSFCRRCFKLFEKAVWDFEEVYEDD